METPGPDASPVQSKASAKAPAARRPAKKKAKAISKQAAKAAASKPVAKQVWPGGSSWLPSTQHWGTRNPAAHGCGKCRWFPQKGCRGCQAAGETYVPRVPKKPLVSGEARLPEPGSDGTSASDLKGLAGEMRTLQKKLHVVSGPQQSDPDGYGVIAAPDGPVLKAGTRIADPSVFYVSRPSAYAAAHLPLFHAVEIEVRILIGCFERLAQLSSVRPQNAREALHLRNSTRCRRGSAASAIGGCATPASATAVSPTSSTTRVCRARCATALFLSFCLCLSMYVCM